MKYVSWTCPVRGRDRTYSFGFTNFSFKILILQIVILINRSRSASNGMKKRIRSLGYALNGIKEAYKRDENFRLEIWASLFYAAFSYMMWPLETYELLFLILSYVLIIVTELVNTAFEQAFEKLHPERDEFIGISKDIAAAAVLVAVLFAVAVGGVIFFEHMSIE